MKEHTAQLAHKPRFHQAIEERALLEAARAGGVPLEVKFVTGDSWAGVLVKKIHTFTLELEREGQTFVVYKHGLLYIGPSPR